MPTHRFATRYVVLICCAIVAWAWSACAGSSWAQTLDIPAAAIPSEPLLGAPAAPGDLRAGEPKFPPGDIPAALPTPAPERGGNLIQSTFSPETGVQQRPELAGASEPAAEVVLDEWRWQFLPDGLMYPAYLAGGREPRFASLWIYRRGDGWLWDSALGGQVGLIRYGSEDGPWPEGWQIDFAGAAFTRQDMERDLDVREVDYRLAVPLTYRRGIFEFKFGYYHVCSHLADEYMILNPDSLNTRINYVRNGLMLGLALRPWRPLRLYTEIGYSVHTDGGAEPWEFQFGGEFVPAEPMSLRGSPFFAVDGHLRQEVDFSGNFTIQAGWAWRSRTGHLFRVGCHYFNGLSDQHQFFRQHEDQVGIGLWYDF